MMQLSPKQVLWLVAAGCVAAGLLTGYFVAKQLGQPAERDTTSINAPSSKTIVVAGDISCDKYDAKTAFACRSDNTAALVTSLKPDAVLVVGDNQYPTGALTSYQEAYDKTWGAFKDITYPTPGNHEYMTPDAAGYYDYFGTRAGERGKGYYSFSLGDWRIIALNSEIDVSSKSPQLAWLAQELKDHPAACTLAFWHQPRFSTGGHSDNPTYDALWRVLYANNVDIVINGHSHGYERFAPQNPDGQIDPAHGITEFVSGLGGANTQALKAPAASLATRQNHAFGVLKLNLFPKAAHYEFVPVPGPQNFTDSNTILCH